MKNPPPGSAIEDGDDRKQHLLSVPTTPVAPEHGETKIDYLSADTRGPVQTGTEARGRRKSNDSAARVTTASAHSLSRSQSANNRQPTEKEMLPSTRPLAKDITDENMEGWSRRRWRQRNPWSFSLLTLGTVVAAAALLYAIADSFVNRQRDQPGCKPVGMRPSYVRFLDFDTEHTRFGSKYSLYLYREVYIDQDERVSTFLTQASEMARQTANAMDRSRVFPSSSSPATRAAISNAAPSQASLHTTSTTRSTAISMQLRMARPR
jgi:hypothetical protein